MGYGSGQRLSCVINLDGWPRDFTCQSQPRDMRTEIDQPGRDLVDMNQSVTGS